MDIGRLKYFVSIVDAGSYRKAAALLRVSPAALSKAMTIFEDEVGFELFVRSGRGVNVTDRGRVLAGRGQMILRQIAELQTETTELKVPTREVKVATFEVFSTHFLKWLDLLDERGMRLVLHEVLPGELERALLEKKACLGITYMPVPHPDLDYIKAARAEMGVFTLQGAFPGVPSPELPFVVPAMPIAGSPSRIRGLDGWPDNAYPRKVQYEVTLMESALELCRQGRCAGYFPVFVVAAHNAKVRPELRLERRWPTDAHLNRAHRACSTDVYIVKRKSDTEGPAVRKIARALRLACQVRVEATSAPPAPRAARR